MHRQVAAESDRLHGRDIEQRAGAGPGIGARRSPTLVAAILDDTPAGDVQAGQAETVARSIVHSLRRRHSSDRSLPRQRPSRLLRDSRTLQTRLTVGSADDPAEREADQAADLFVAALRVGDEREEGRAGISSTLASARRRPGPTASTAEVGADGGEISADLSSRISRGGGGGAPIESGLRSKLEGAFGVDLGHVRVHAASPLPAEVAAEAFTVGSRIHFAPGRYDPSTDAGRHLISHEVAHVVQQRAASVRREGEAGSFPIAAVSEGVGRRIQRKGAHFWNYVTKHTVGLDPAKSATHKDMLIVGWLLDQNIYDLEALLSGAQKDIDWQNYTLLGSRGLVISDVAAFLHAQGAPLGESADRQMQFLTRYVAKLPEALTTIVSAEAARKGKAASRIRWLGLLPWGAGAGVHLQMLPGGLPTGSQPDSEPVWMKTVEQHHPSTNNTTLYVRGHLLNHNIGGPGLDYNMVPITGKPAKNVGGNDANAEHLRTIEDEAKKTWDLVAAGKLTEAHYGVEPQYNRAPRAETARVRAAERAMRTVLDNARAVVVARLQQLNPLQLQQAWLTKTSGHGVQGFVPSPQQMIEMLAQAEVGEAEGATVATLRAGKSTVMAAVDAAVPASLLDASADGKASVVSLRDLYSMVNGNAATWEAEERFIPTAIRVALETTDPAGKKSMKGPIDVPVTLSTDVGNVYYRPKKESEDA